MINLLAGDNKNYPNGFSWNGNTNLSWLEFINEMFGKRKDFGTDFEYYASGNIEHESREVWPFKRCIELKNVSDTLSMGTNEPTYIILIDPKRYVSHRVLKNAMIGQEISQERGMKDQKTTDKYFTVQISEHKLRPEKGSCKEYSNQQGFGICVQVVLCLILKRETMG